MEKKKRTKKYPILRYLSYLVIVGILLTGVSLARYSGATSGGVSTPLSRFLCSYEDLGRLFAHFFQFRLLAGSGRRGAERDEHGAHGALYAAQLPCGRRGRRGQDQRRRSAEHAALLCARAVCGRLAVQVAEVGEDGGYTVVTPQYVLRDFIYEVSVGADGKYEGGRLVRKRRTHSKHRPLRRL